MIYHSEYLGVTIYRKATPGFALPWEAYCKNRFIHADTLKGLRQLIASTIRNFGRESK